MILAIERGIAALLEHRDRVAGVGVPTIPVAGEHRHDGGGQVDWDLGTKLVRPRQLVVVARELDRAREDRLHRVAGKDRPSGEQLMRHHAHGEDRHGQREFDQGEPGSVGQSAALRVGLL